jgi:predicted Zn-dependent peptidase
VFGDWPAGGDPFAADPVPHPSPLERTATRVVERPVHAVSGLLAWHGPSVARHRRATYVADVLSFVLGQRNSRFYRRLVDSGLASSASLHYQTLCYTGPLQVQFVAAPERAAEAHAVLCEEIDALAEPATFTDQEIDNAKSQLEIDQIYEAERPSHLVHTLGYWWAVADLEYYTDYAACVREITREDLNDFARRYLVGQPRVTGILVAPEDRPRLGALAEETG